MNQLDVLFVIPMNVNDLKGGVNDAIEPPAAARRMIAYELWHGASVDLIDANVTGQTPEQIARDIAYFTPRLVVMPVYGYNPSASTQTMVSARALCEAIKDAAPDIPIMMSGTHPAAIPRTTLLTEPAVDYVCGGEGPYTVHDLLKAIKGGGGIENVRSLWYRKDGGIAHNEAAPLLDLDSLAPWILPAWNYMDPRKYRPHHWQQFYQNEEVPYANPYSREGCPHQCHFCNIQAPYREGELIDPKNLLRQAYGQAPINSFRTLRPDLFVKEVAYLVDKFGVRHFKIPDEMFGLGNHPMQVAEGLAEYFGPDDLNFWCYYRVDSCHPSHLERLRRAGIRWIGLGIEAADSAVRSGQDKGYKDDDIYKVVERMHANEIEGGLNYIFGLSNFHDDGTLESCDTMETMVATRRMAFELNGAYGNFYCDQALPGSPQYDFAKKMGYPLPEREGGPGWIGHAQYSFECEPFYPGEALTPAEILKFRDEAHVAYYKNPDYRNRLLRDPKFGQRALANIDAWIANLEPEKFKRKLIEEAEAGQPALASR